MVCIRPALLYPAHICLLPLLLHTIAGTLAVESIHLFISLLVKKNNFNVTVTAHHRGGCNGLAHWAELQ